MASSLDYLAGYLDANGCFYIAKTKSRGGEPDNYVGKIIVHSRKHTDVVNELADEFGGSVYRTSKGSQWHINSNQALMLCELVKPKLRFKKSQAICLIAIQKMKTGKYRNRATIRKQEQLYKQIKQLKQ